MDESRPTTKSSGGPGHDHIGTDRLVRITSMDCRMRRSLVVSCFPLRICGTSTLLLSIIFSSSLLLRTGISRNTRCRVSLATTSESVYHSIICHRFMKAFLVWKANSCFLHWHPSVTLCHMLLHLHALPAAISLSWCDLDPTCYHTQMRILAI